MLHTSAPPPHPRRPSPGTRGEGRADPVLPRSRGRPWPRASEPRQGNTPPRTLARDSGRGEGEGVEAGRMLIPVRPLIPGPSPRHRGEGRPGPPLSRSTLAWGRPTHIGHARATHLKPSTADRGRVWSCEARQGSDAHPKLRPSSTTLPPVSGEKGEAAPNVRGRAAPTRVPQPTRARGTRPRRTVNRQS